MGKKKEEVALCVELLVYKLRDSLPPPLTFIVGGRCKVAAELSGRLLLSELLLRIRKEERKERGGGGGRFSFQTRASR